MDRESFDSLMARMDTAMIVLTANDGDERAGCLIGFHTQCSIEPRRYAIWVSRRNHTYRVARQARLVAVHLLGEGDRDLAEHFGGQTGDEVDKFAGVTWEPGPDGVPLLVRCPNRFLARQIVVHDDDSDHMCLVVEPIEASSTDTFRPLRFDAIQDIDPGHEAG